MPGRFFIEPQYPKIRKPLFQPSLGNRSRD